MKNIINISLVVLLATFYSCKKQGVLTSLSDEEITLKGLEVDDEDSPDGVIVETEDEDEDEDDGTVIVETEDEDEDEDDGTIIISSGGSGLGGGSGPGGGKKGGIKN